MQIRVRLFAALRQLAGWPQQTLDLTEGATVTDALAERFRFSQQFMQDDPWAARVAGAEREHHAPMATFTPTCATEEMA